jgi:MoaA/NifB/PqqE/SkfB family radical SAM enzyme
MLSGLTRLFKRERRDFDTFQIEISSYSSLESQFSPRAVFAEKWRFEQMSLETFQKMALNFPQARWVVFRGWGDPLENENFPAMFELARQVGCRTALATHGFHLTPEISRQLVEGGLDLITINLKEIPPAGEERQRVSAEFSQILSRIRDLVALKKSLGMDKPRVRLSMIMTRLNMGRLPRIVPAAVSLGADEVTLRNLDYLPDDRWNILRAFHHESPTPAFQAALDEILRLGREMNIPVSHSPLKAEEVPVCEAQPHDSLFVSVNGSVAPCMYLCLPKKGRIPRIFLNESRKVDPRIFGNINEEELAAIWAREKYRSFRRRFEGRIRARENAADIVDAMANPAAALQKMTAPPPLSKSCQTCYKAYGI